MYLDELFESLSRVAYHYTGPGAALKILKSGQFELSSALGSVEQQYAPPGYPYFMSTTRTRQGGYHQSSSLSRGVIFVLDGNWFNQRYRSQPLDYWGNRGTGPRASEAEDRVFSREPTIPIGGVTAVHVFLDTTPSGNDSESDRHNRAVVRELLLAAKTQGIPAYFYTDRKAWINQDQRRLGDVKTLTGIRKPSWYRPPRGRTYMQSWVELMNAPSRSQLTKDADRLLYNLRSDYNREQARQSLSTDMSNARKPESGPEREDAVKIIRYMQKNRLATLGDFVDHLAAKWQQS